jgi:hypothetical protein
MPKTLDEVIAEAKTLPESLQNELAELLLALSAQQQPMPTIAF